MFSTALQQQQIITTMSRMSRLRGSRRGARIGTITYGRLSMPEYDYKADQQAHATTSTQAISSLLEAINDILHLRDLYQLHSRYDIVSPNI
jgi:hypothetical protein